MIQKRIQFFQRLLKETNVLPCNCLDLHTVAEKTKHWSETNIHQLVTFTFNQTCLELLERSYQHNVVDRFDPSKMCLHTGRFLHGIYTLRPMIQPHSPFTSGTCHKKDQAHMDRIMCQESESNV
jgi:hypothetical protein